MTNKRLLPWIILLLPALTLITACDRKPSITTTEEGLIIETLVGAKGAQAAVNDEVSVHYTGWLFDDSAPEHKGKKFDSSVDRKVAFTFMLGQGQVIKGWDQGVAGMRVGEQRRLTIPSDLAYGSRGAGALIPPGSTLVFDVELLGIAKLKVIDNKVGSGEQAVKGTSVSVQYTGWLYDNNATDNKGLRFDSSIDRDEPFTFTLGAKQVISGWDEGVTGMRTGGHRTLIIPPGLAYGKRGYGKSIPPDATLLFEIELLAVDAGALQ